MKRTLLGAFALFGVVAVLLGLAAWLFLGNGSTRFESAEGSTLPVDEEEPFQQDTRQVLPAPEPDSRLNRLENGSVEFLPALEISRSLLQSDSIKDSLGQLESIFGLYRFAFGENPVGVENFEITEQLLGKNPKNVIFIAADSPSLRGKELVDTWGTPFFFHSVSATQMDIRSAGPDKTFWTSDDIELVAN